MKTEHVVGGGLMIAGVPGVLSQLFLWTPNTIIFCLAMLALLGGALCIFGGEESE